MILTTDALYHRLCLLCVYAGSPLSLARQSRVVLRKVLGPMGIQTKSYKYFPEMVQQYLIDIRDDCCADNEMKRHALNQAEVLVPTKSGEKKRPL